MNHFSLFTGIGGIDLAAEWAGFKTVGQVELAEYPYQILMKHWPNVPKFRGVKDVNRNSIRAAGIEHIDLISAGFPCQPHSLAGKRKGSCDDRDLWPEVARVLREVRPRWFLGENVKGLLSSENGRFFGTVLGDLAEMGYSVGWGSWEAARVGAPHRRERVFIVAYSDQVRCNMWESYRQGVQREEQTCDEIDTSDKYVANANHSGRIHGKPEEFTAERRIDAFGEFEPSCSHVPHSDNKSKLQTREAIDPFRESGQTRNCTPGDGGAFISGFDWWSTEPDVGRVANGISSRVDRLKCLGNAVVPQQVYPLLKEIYDLSNVK